MQEDKEQTFDALENLFLVIAAMTGMVGDMKPNLEKLGEAAGHGYSTATDLADWLVRELGLPFRDAHHVTGAIVALAEGEGVGLDGLTLEQMQTVEPRLTDGIFDVLTVEKSVASRKAFGGTAPENVAREAKRWSETLDQEAKKAE